MKIQLSLNDDLVQRMDDEAKRNYLSRSALVTIAMGQYLNGKELIVAVRDMAVALRSIADKGHIDEQDAQRLQDLENLVLMLSNRS